MKNRKLFTLVLAAMFLAVGLILPLFTGQIKQIGNMLLPMHIPVLLCGLVCGWQYGMGIGFILPLMRSVIFGMPVMYPTAAAMAVELAAYGFIAGFMYSRARWQCIRSLYRCILCAMIGGRILWGASMSLLMYFGGGGAFTFEMFIAGAFLNAIPGIVVQLILIPAIMLALDKTHLVHFKKHKKQEVRADAAK